MYRIIPLLLFLCTADSATYGLSTIYPGVAGYSSNYQYPSMSPYPNTYQQNRGSYVNDLAIYPDATRYPNYSPGSTTGYNSYGSYPITPRTDYGSNYGSGYSSNYGSGYGSNSFQSPYSTPRYGTAYGGRSYSPYEMPFMKGSEYCVNRTPQKDIWVDSLMGMWYGVEYVQHLAGDSILDYARTCIVMHIAEPMDRVSSFFSLVYLCYNIPKFLQSEAFA